MISLTDLITEQYGRIDSILILATTLVLEAGGEGETGMLAVAHVIANRAKSNHMGWGTRPTQQALRPYQFSMWNSFNAGTDKLITIINKAKRGWPTQWVYAEKLAKQIYTNTLPAGNDITKGAVYYYNPATAEADSLKFTKHPDYVKTATIGKHVFGVIKSDNTATNKPNKKAKSYTIKPGETLGGIANRNSTTIDAILKLNKGLSADNIKAGQQIKV